MTELRARVTVVNRLGIHARAAALLVDLARRYRSEIVLDKDGQRARATSVLELLMLCGQCGSRLEVCVRGEDTQDAKGALDAVCALFAERFGEPD